MTREPSSTEPTQPHELPDLMPGLHELVDHGQSRARRISGVAVRVAISMGLMIFLFTRIPSFDTGEMMPEWNGSTPYWLLVALALTAAGFAMSIVRWYQVLHAVELDVPGRRLASHYLAGQFVSNFVPTTVGGDVLRVSRLSRDTGQTPASFASVVFERLSGWLALPVFTLVGLALNPGLRDLGGPTRLAFITAVVTLVALALLILLVGNDRFGDHLDQGSGWREWFNAVHLGIDRLRAHPVSARNVVLAAFAYQFVVLLAAGAAVEAMNIDQVGLTALMAFLPVVLIVQVLPVGIGGLGLREGALVIFLSRLGVADERAIALGLLLYFLTLASSLSGLPALVFGWARRSTVAAVTEPTPVVEGS